MLQKTSVHLIAKRSRHLNLISFAAVGAVGSEAGSLSNSCSTLDSTDTLCNTTESNDLVNIKLIGVMSLPDNDTKRTLESDQRHLDGVPDHPRPVLTRSYPGRAVPCTPGSVPAENSISDYNKALRYADETIANNSSLHFKDSLSGIAGTGDPSDCNGDLETSGPTTSRLITAKMKKIAASPRKTSPKEWLSSGRDNVSRGNVSCQSCDPSSTVKNDQPATGPVSLSQSSDPESGEGMDQLKPLFQSENSPPKISNTPANQHLHSLPAHQGGKSRERTMSSSSVASDGWGASSDVIHKHDFFKVLSAVSVTSAVSSRSGEPRPCKGGCRAVGG